MTLLPTAGWASYPVYKLWVCACVLSPKSRLGHFVESLCWERAHQQDMAIWNTLSLAVNERTVWKS